MCGGEGGYVLNATLLIWHGHKTPYSGQFRSKRRNNKVVAAALNAKLGSGKFDVGAGERQNPAESQLNKKMLHQLQPSIKLENRHY